MRNASKRKRSLWRSESCKRGRDCRWSVASDEKTQLLATTNETLAQLREDKEDTQAGLSDGLTLCFQAASLVLSCRAVPDERA